MYDHPLLGIYGQKKMPKRKPGRPSNRSKFEEKQRDMFPAEKILARSAAQVSEKFEAESSERFFYLRRCSTADSSGLAESGA